MNTASTAGLKSRVGIAAYAASWAAVISLTRSMAVEIAPHAIRVNGIAPGLIRTPLTAERLDTNAWFRDTMVGGTPLGRWGEPEEIAAAAAFVCSDDASFVTGQTLAVGGYDVRTPRLPAGTGIATVGMLVTRGQS